MKSIEDLKKDIVYNDYLTYFKERDQRQEVGYLYEKYCELFNKISQSVYLYLNKQTYYINTPLFQEENVYQVCCNNNEEQFKFKIGSTISFNIKQLKLTRIELNFTMITTYSSFSFYFMFRFNTAEAAGNFLINKVKDYLRLFIHIVQTGKVADEKCLRPSLSELKIIAKQFEPDLGINFKNVNYLSNENRIYQFIYKA